MNINYETALIGCLIKKPELSYQVSLDVSYFHDELRDIYIAIRKLIDERNPIDFYSIWSHLPSNTKVSMDYMLYITENPMISHFKHYLSEVEKEGNKDKMIIKLDLMSNALKAGEQVDVYKEVQDIALSQTKSAKALLISEIIANNIEDQKRILSTGVKPYIKTKYESIDKLISGLQGGDLVVLAGRPSTGKSTLAMNLAMRMSVDSDKPVIYYSLEMTNDKLGYRVISLIGSVSSAEARDGRLYSKSKVEYEEIQQKSMRYNFKVNGDPKSTFEDIRDYVMAENALGGVKLLIIDYLQLMDFKFNRKIWSTNDRVSQLTRGLKELAMELKIPILILSQLSRATEKDKRPKPMMSDLRDSGSIEQDADIIMFLYYADEKQKEVTYGDSLVQLSIPKVRDGQVGEVTLAYNKSINRFSEYHYKKM